MSMAAHNGPTDFKKFHPIQLSGLPQHSIYEDLKLGPELSKSKAQN